MKSPFCMKVCTKCGGLLVANSMNFSKMKAGKYGLSGQCKRCRNNHQAEYYQNNKDKKAEYDAKYRQSNKNKIAEYRQNNKEKIAKLNAKYYQDNKDKIAKRNAEYRKNNPDKFFNYEQKRRQLEEFGPGISKEEWIDMMEFFDWKCAYSGEPLTHKNRSIDHVVPLKNYGYNGIINCVPCTISANSSKQASDMIEWYKQQDFYSDKRLNKIYEWIEYSINKYTDHITITM